MSDSAVPDIDDQIHHTSPRETRLARLRAKAAEAKLSQPMRDDEIQAKIAEAETRVSEPRPEYADMSDFEIQAKIAKAEAALDALGPYDELHRYAQHEYGYWVGEAYALSEELRARRAHREQATAARAEEIQNTYEQAGFTKLPEDMRADLLADHDLCECVFCSKQEALQIGVAWGEEKQDERAGD